MATQGMHEVQRYATLSDHGYLGYAVIVNRKFWLGLPSDLRAALERALAETTTWANANAEAENLAAVETMRASGKTEFITLTPDERALWMAALKPVQQAMADRVGRDLLESIWRATGETP